MRKIEFDNMNYKVPADWLVWKIIICRVFKMTVTSNLFLFAFEKTSIKLCFWCYRVKDVNWSILHDFSYCHEHSTVQQIFDDNMLYDENRNKLSKKQ